MKRYTMAAVCATALATSASAQEGKTLTYADFQTVQTNWQMASDDSYLGSRAGCFETLVRLNWQLQLEPGLATSWKQVEPMVWEFTLRDGVKFQDGAPLTAEAVVGALKHLLAAEMPARPFSPKLIKSVEAVGEKVVRIITRPLRFCCRRNSLRQTPRSCRPPPIRARRSIPSAVAPAPSRSLKSSPRNI